MKDLDDLYCRCMCKAPWTAHDATGICPDQPEIDFQLEPYRYRPMIGRFGRSKNRPLQTYQEVFGHDPEE